MIDIIQGEDKAINIKLIQDDEPFDLTSVTEITACFLKTDNTNLELTKTDGAITIVDNAVLGKIKITIGDADTALLKKSTQSFEVTLDTSGYKQKVQFLNSLNIVESLCG
jgi:hypothetical protein